jgi:cell division ATPase FtsA
MARGIVSPREKDALPVMRLIIERLLGPPGRPGEPCVFSVPAKPVDSDANAVYHEKLFEGLLARLGYAPRPIREGHAVVLSDLAEDDFTGIGVSCGGGMFNVCVAYKAVSVLGFSTSRGGDWIDANVAQALGIPRSRATAVKESGIDIREPSSRESAAVAIYARELIRSTLAIISRRFESAADRPDFPEPVDLVFAGGTSLVGGFVEVAREELSRLAFPLPVKRVRLADDPLHAVSRGCLVMALSGTDA